MTYKWFSLGLLSLLSSTFISVSSCWLGGVTHNFTCVCDPELSSSFSLAPLKVSIFLSICSPFSLQLKASACLYAFLSLPSLINRAPEPLVLLISCLSLPTTSTPDLEAFSPHAPIIVKMAWLISPFALIHLSLLISHQVNMYIKDGTIP